MAKISEPYSRAIISGPKIQVRIFWAKNWEPKSIGQTFCNQNIGAKVTGLNHWGQNIDPKFAGQAFQENIVVAKKLSFFLKKKLDVKYSVEI